MVVSPNLVLSRSEGATNAELPLSLALFMRLRHALALLSSGSPARSIFQRQCLWQSWGQICISPPLQGPIRRQCQETVRWWRRRGTLSRLWMVWIAVAAAVPQESLLYCVDHEHPGTEASLVSIQSAVAAAVHSVRRRPVFDWCLHVLAHFRCRLDWPSRGNSGCKGQGRSRRLRISVLPDRVCWLWIFVWSRRRRCIFVWSARRLLGNRVVVDEWVVVDDRNRGSDGVCLWSPDRRRFQGQTTLAANHPGSPPVAHAPGRRRHDVACDVATGNNSGD